MSNAEPLVARTASDTGDSASLFELTQPSEAATVSTLREAVDTFVRRYLDEMEGRRARTSTPWSSARWRRRCCRR
jgi:Fis family transcriptional regulator